MATPNLILLGYGVTDSLQLTVESQRILSRYGAACVVSLPPNLSSFLKSQRVRVTDLAQRFAPGRPFAEAYLDVAHELIARTATERPVIFLAPGNPMMFNALGRYLAMEGRRLGLSVQAVPAVSPLDLIVSSIGLDVSTFGLQVFDATRLVARRIQLNPAAPALLMHLDSFGLAAVPTPERPADLEALVAHLAGCYPPDHPATIVTLDSQGTRIANLPLGRLAAASREVQPGAHLFLDLARRQAAPTETPA
jgi:precorrin-6B methylase 1